MRTQLIAVAALAALLCTTGATAQMETPRGFYLAGGAGAAIHNFDDEGFDFSQAGGGNGRFGYRIARWVAVEGQYDFAGRYDASGVEADLRLHTATVNARAYPREGLLQPYGLVGLGVMHANLDADAGDASDEGFAMRVGAGVDLFADGIVTLFLETSYVIPFGDVDDFQYATIGGGALFRLGGP